MEVEILMYGKKILKILKEHGGTIAALLGVFLASVSVNKQLKANINYDIYNKFVELGMDVQKSLINFCPLPHAPFIQMDSSMALLEIKLSTEEECVSKGGKEWEKFTDELYENYTIFTEKYLDLLFLFENWSAVFGPLLLPERHLKNEIYFLKEEMYHRINILKEYKYNQKSDWRDWDRKEINKMVSEIHEAKNSILFFLGDFMVLLHNEILSSYFRKKRLTRKTLSPEFKVLTKKGVIVNLDNKLISKMKKYKIKHDIIVKNKIKKTNKSEKIVFLKSLEKGVCPTCQNKIEIIEHRKTKKDFSFYYICGHKWEDTK